MDNPEKLAIQGIQYAGKHNTICVGYHFAQPNTNNVNKIWALLQTTGGIDEPNSFYAENVTDITTRNSERKRHIIAQHKKLKRWATQTHKKPDVLAKGKQFLRFLQDTGRFIHIYSQVR